MNTTIDKQLDIQFNEEGFMVNPNQWSREIAADLAAKINLELTTEHWQIIDFCRNDFAETGESPTLRRITTVGGIPTKRIYQLFPKKPAKKVAFVSGLKKPTGCI